MNTQINIDDALINEALRLGHFASKEDMVMAALREFIQHHKQSKKRPSRSGVVFGVMQGELQVPDNFDDPLPEKIENEFYTSNL